MPGLQLAGGFLRRHRAAVASWAALSLAATSLVAYAVTSKGFPAHKADLNDGGVWVTNQAIGAVGRQNVPISQLDAFAWGGKPAVPLAGLDVLQNAAAVVSYDPAGTLTPIDVSLGQSQADQQVPITGTALLGGSALAVVDPNSGKVWATQVDPVTGIRSLSSVSHDSRPLATIGAEAAGAVAEDGTIFAASGARNRLITMASHDGAVGSPTTSALRVRPDGGLTAMAVVGDTPVLLDKAGRVLVGGHAVTVGDGAQLQETGPAADSALVATQDALASVSLSNGKRTVVYRSAFGETPGRPVRLGNCDWQVWFADHSAHAVTACDGQAPTLATVENVGPAPQMVWRVNRNQIVLNDVTSGDVWRVDGSTAKQISDWPALMKSPDQKQQADPNPDQSAKQTPPIANPDDLGVRPGRTTVLHVLDNDRASASAILAIVGFQAKSLPDGVTVDIAPDRQSLLLTTVATAAAGDYSFTYTIDDGSGSAKPTADGKVTLHVLTSGAPVKPTTRDNYQEPVFATVAGGTVEIPVTGDWRDEKYGDPIAVSNVKADVGSVSVTPEGLVKYTAPASGAAKHARITYDASTGGDTASGSVSVTIVGPNDKPVPAVANPDAAAGEVGGAIVVHPLDNDVPGADALHPNATMKIAAPVAPVRGQSVETDREAGTVTLRPTQPGTYLLTYHVGDGDAATATGNIRVTVTPRSQDAEVPVAAPDTATIRGQSPTTVDVLANDVDPRGGMLAVTATSTSPDSRLKVAIVAGRWLRVSADDAQLASPVQAVQYTVTNGVSSATGSLTVTQEKPLDATDNAPVPEPDEVTVRAGTEADIPVLDNDSTPSGDPVGLGPAPASADNPSGRYPVAGDPKRDLGKAYLAGRRVRYVAPADDGLGPLDAHIQYTAVNTGEPLAQGANSEVTVHVVPKPGPDNPNHAPTPRTLEGRVVQGDTVTLHLPPVGLDPDGDPVSIVSVGDVAHGAPHLGRVVATSGGALTYQAFPGQAGTDQFAYIVADPYGATAVGIARVAVVPPGPPQPPVALDDLVTADAGRTVTVDVLANDLRTPGTRLTLAPMARRPAGVTAVSENGTITVKASSTQNDAIEVPYTATNGIDTSNAVLTVRTQKGYDNPPIAEDVVAAPDPGATSVTVDVLAHVTDVDDAVSDLALKVTGLAATKAGKVTIPVTTKPQVFPYEVVDPRGAVAAAVIRVPARPAGTPYLKKDARIQLQPGQTVTRSLSDLVDDPEHDQVVLTTLDSKAIFGAPDGVLQVSASGTTLKISADRNADPGPASVTFTVSDRARLADPTAHVVTLSVPVQVGTDKPVVTCPGAGDPLTVAEGGRDLVIDVPSVCHVWTSTPSEARSLHYSGTWAQALAGVSMSDKSGRIVLHTGAGAHEGDRGAVQISVDGEKTAATVAVLVTKLPPPSLSTVNVDGHAGKPLTVDLAKYLRTRVAPDALDVKVTAASQTMGPAARVSRAGSKVTITPAAGTSGQLRFRVEVSDLGAASTRPRAVGEVRVAVAAPPGPPGSLTAGGQMLSNTVLLSWSPADPHGARVTSYEVSYSSNGGPSGTYPCSASPCRVTGLKNGVTYTFSVVAVNAEGKSAPSNRTTAHPDKVTGPVLDLKVVQQRDHTVSLSWSPPAKVDASPASSYTVSWPGGSCAQVTATHCDAKVGANGQDYTFTVVAFNDTGKPGTPATVTGMGAGKPDAPAKPTFVLQDRPGNRKAVQINWGAVDPNGPSPVQYKVTRVGASTPICDWQTATSCADDLPLDGTTYSYTVTARNAEETSPREAGTPGNHVSPSSPAGTVESASTPDAMSVSSYVATGTDQQVRVAFTTGASHGSTNRVECTVNGATCAGSPWTYAVTGASDTKTLGTSVPNGSTATIQLRACNGSSGSSQTGAQCSAWVSKQTTPYGPIPTPSISVSASADHIVGSASWNANGKPVDVRITRNGSTIYSANGVGNGSTSINDPIGYSQTGNYVITVSDTGLWPGQTSPRASKSASASATTPPPPKSVTVSKTGNAQGQPGCTDPSCAYIVATTANFPGPVTCYVSDAAGGTGGFITWPQGGNQTKQSPNYYGYAKGWVEVTCDGVTSPRFYW
ncbi:MAG TPA: Ig-like domain-containing protein [Marmoricola sp.]|nr:Ig-like domain-containing protein [Marmoricola sp.]